MQPLIQRQLAPVRSDAQHIVDMGVNLASAHTFRTLAKFLHHFFLEPAGFGSDGDMFCFWHGEVEHIGGLDVGGFFPDRNQFRQVVKLGKPCLGAEAAALRL